MQTTVSVGGSSESEPVVQEWSEQCRERVTFMLERTPCLPAEYGLEWQARLLAKWFSMRACVGCAAVLIEANAQVALSGHLKRDLRWSPGAQVDVCCPQESEIGVAWERLQLLERLSDEGGAGQVQSDVVRGGICGVSAGTAREGYPRMAQG